VHVRNTETNIGLSGYRLPLVVEQVEDSFQATRPALEGFLVLAGSLEDVLALAPGIARALLEAMQDKGVAPPITLEKVNFPTQLEVLVPV
jgi:hypothetical protein